MRTSEKISHSRGFVSPSFQSDIAEPSPVQAFLGMPAAMMAGKWLFKRFPKASVIGLLAVGGYVAYNMIKKDRPASISDILKH